MVKQRLLNNGLLRRNSKGFLLNSEKRFGWIRNLLPELPGEPIEILDVRDSAQQMGPL